MITKHKCKKCKGELIIIEDRANGDLVEECKDCKTQVLTAWKIPIIKAKTWRNKKWN